MEHCPTYFICINGRSISLTWDTAVLLHGFLLQLYPSSPSPFSGHRTDGCIMSLTQNRMESEIYEQ